MYFNNQPYNSGAGQQNANPYTYNPYSNYQPNSQQQVPKVIAQLVSNVQEAAAYIVSTPDIYLFLNLNAGEIYGKRILQDGSIPLQVFKIQTAQDPQSSNGLRVDGIGATLEAQSRILNEIYHSVNALTEGAKLNERSGTNKSGKAGAKSADVSTADNPN